LKTKNLKPSTAEIPALPDNVQLLTLDNGLQIILCEDHAAPVVSAQAWCKSGSIHEGRWLGAGLSHLLEHMLFKGTARRGPGVIDREVHAAGGQMNAYTSFDRTVYHIDVPSTGARLALDILADVMQNAAIPEDELAKEMEVIRREMDMNQDDPRRRSSKRLFEVAYLHSPFRFTVIGYPDIFNELKRADVYAYYREKYAPNNTFFVVAGDINPQEVAAQLGELYAGAKARPLPPEALPDEPRQLAPREVIEAAPIEMAHLHFAWHVPGLRHPDLPALDVLALILGCGRSSRLYQAVRDRQGLVNSVDAWIYSPGAVGLFGLSALTESAKFAAAQPALLREIERARSRLVTEAELEKAVKQFTTAHLATRKTMAGQAQDLGANWLAAGDLNFSARYLAAVRRCRREDLRRVAETYLIPDNRTLCALVPEGLGRRAALAAPRAATSRARLFRLPNGLRLVFKEDHRLPFVEFRVSLRGGVLAESADENGASLLMSRLLLKGTRRRSAEQIATEIESLGGGLDSYGGNNSIGLSLEVLGGDFAQGLDLLADVLRHPAFSAEAFHREREVQLASLKNQRDHLLTHALCLMRRALFGPRGYGLDTLGTEESLAGLSVARLRALHQRLVAPDNCVLAVAGDFDAVRARAALRKCFSDWTGKAALPPLPEPPAQRTAARVEERRDKKQAVLALGFPGATLAQPDRYALDLLHEACSDMGSRLFARIREQLGLAYYVGAMHLPGLTPGCFAFYAGTDPEKAAFCEEEMLKEIASLRDDGLTPEELARVKAKVVGHRKIARQDLGGVAAAMALDELYGLGFEYGDQEDQLFEAVTSDQIRAAARSYFAPDRLVVASITP